MKRIPVYLFFLLSLVVVFNSSEITWLNVNQDCTINLKVAGGLANISETYPNCFVVKGDIVYEVPLLEQKQYFAVGSVEPKWTVYRVDRNGIVPIYTVDTEQTPVLYSLVDGVVILPSGLVSNKAIIVPDYGISTVIQRGDIMYQDAKIFFIGTLEPFEKAKEIIIKYGDVYTD